MDDRPGGIVWLFLFNGMSRETWVNGTDECGTQRQTRRRRPVLDTGYLSS